MRLSRPLLLVFVPVVLAACDSGAPSDLDPSIRALLSGPLVIGDVESFGGANASEIAVDGGLEGADYLFVVSNTSTVGGSFTDVTIRGEGLASGATVSNDPAGRPSLSASGSALASGGQELVHPPEDDGGFHLWHLEREARFVRERLGSLSQSARSLLLEGAAAAAAQPVPNVGDIVPINVNSSNPCGEPIWQDARVEAVSAQAIVLNDLRNPNGLTQQDFEDIARDFDEKVYPLTLENFGAPARMIGPERTTIFYSVAVNELASNFGGLVGGFFFSRDLFPRVAGNGFPACDSSNEREMFYMLTADPQGEFSREIPVEDIRGRTIATVMHEHQHLVNASRRLYILESGNLEAVWLNEALSHVGEELLFYQESGMSPRQNISVNDVRQSQPRLDAVNNFQVQNLVRYSLYLEDAPAQSPINPEDALEMRGAAWSFLRFLTDHYANGDAAFFQSLVNTTDVGIDNLENRIGEDLSGPLYRWDVANYADDLVTDLDASFRQPSWDFRSLLPELSEAGSFPLSAETLIGSQTVSASIRGGSAAFVRFSVPSGTRVTLTTLTGGSPLPPAMRGTVVRLR